MAGMATINGSPTGGANPWVDSLVWGAAWTGNTAGKVKITYAFKSGLDPRPQIDPSTGKIWAADEAQAVRNAIAAWEAVANVDFVEVSPFSSGTDMWFWLGDEAAMEGNYGFAEVPDPENNQNTPLYMVLNYEKPEWTEAARKQGGFSYAVILHELGHALGLAHPHDGGTQTTGTIFPGVTGEFDSYGDRNLNQGVFTTMSYNDGFPTRFPQHNSPNFGNQATPMALDVAAVQAIYGASTTAYHSGNDNYVLPLANSNGIGWINIWDTGGIDTISCGLTTQPVLINLAPPNLDGSPTAYVSSVQGVVGGFTVSYGVVIEIAYGGNGNDNIAGNSADNYLVGRAGNDQINGWSGKDTLSGGLGNDTLNGGSNYDTVTYSQLQVAVNANLTRGSALSTTESGHDTYVSIEHLTGGAGNDWLTGDFNKNTLRGGAGNDRLDGGSVESADLLVGGTGNDTYIVDSSNDNMTEYAGEGTEIVYSATAVSSRGSDLGNAAYIGNYVENVTLTGASSSWVWANNLANTINGNGADNQLWGLAGADIMRGGAGDDYLNGGTGADWLLGGADNDSYRLDSTNDKIHEDAFSGDDLVYSSVSVSFSGADYGSFAYIGSQVEDVVLTGAKNIEVKGNSQNNIMVGNTANNRLAGGAGQDILDGNLGIDTLVGGTGADEFRFTTAISNGTSDILTDFETSMDKIVLDSNSVFFAFTTSLTADQFAFGSVALDSNDFALFDQSNGFLRYDEDGSGGIAAIHFATVTVIGGPLSFEDFIVI